MRNDKKISVKKGLLYPLLMLAAFELFYIPIYFAMRPFVGEEWGQTLCDLCVRLPIALHLAKRMARKDGIRESSVPAGPMIGLVIAWIACICLPIQFIFHTTVTPDEYMSVPAAIRFAISAPLMEEAFYRGVMFRQARRGFGYKIAFITNAVIFYFMHDGPIYIFVTLPVSLTACALMEKTGRVRYGMILHLVFNVLGYFMMNMVFDEDLAVWSFLILYPAFVVAFPILFFGKKADLGRQAPEGSLQEGMAGVEAKDGSPTGPQARP